MTKTDEFCNEHQFDDRKRHHLMQTVAQAIAKIETIMPTPDQQSSLSNGNLASSGMKNHTPELMIVDDGTDEQK